jgi:hypothetical protein
MVMLSTYLTAPPPQALPPFRGLLAVLGMELVFALLIAAFAVGTAVLVQHALTRAPRNRRAVRIVEREPTPISHAA